MTAREEDERLWPPRRPAPPEDMLKELATPGPPADFALRVLERVGIPRNRYDTYVRMQCPAGELFLSFSPQALTGAALAGAQLDAGRFEDLHRERTGRSAIPTGKPFRGLVTAIRTGRAKHLPLDLTALPEQDRAVLSAVRTIPPGQLRPLSWILREAALPADHGVEAVTTALIRNPLPVLIPSHRATDDRGRPYDTGYPREAADALRAAEGIDMASVREWSDGGVILLGSATTHIVCHPTCAHARRITPRYRVPFGTAHDAQSAGFRACRSCRPVVA